MTHSPRSSRAPHRTAGGRSHLRLVALPAALLVGATSLTAGALLAPATADPGLAQCPEAAALDQVAAGDHVTGLTTTSGTDPQSFDGSVIGRLTDGIAPGVDMIMVDLTGASIDENGIWFGMSGSPVYTDDGTLLGAVAYGLSYSPSPVAGLTPASEMDSLMDGGTVAAKVPVTARQAQRIAGGSDVSARQASSGFQRLKVPISVSGVGQRTLTKAAQGFDYPTRSVRAAGGSGRAAGTGPAMVAGGNLIASLSYGDVSFAGAGTATEVCDDQVVGFGHPMLWSGRSEMSLHNGDALYVQKDAVFGSFKVANAYAPSGSILQDRQAGIAGIVGPLPATTHVTSDTRFPAYPARNREGAVTQVSVADWLPDIAATHMLANNVRVFDAFAEGSSYNAWTIRGTRADGSPWHLGWDDHYADKYDITFPSALTLYLQLAQLTNTGEDVTVSDVDIDSSMDEAYRHWKVTSAELRRGGQWTTLTRRSGLTVAPGSTLRLRANLVSTRGDERTVQRSLVVPRAAAGHAASLLVGNPGGGDFFFYRAAKTFDDTLKDLRQGDHNDEVQFRLSPEGRNTAGLERETSTRLGAAVSGRARSVVFVARARG